MWNKHRDKQCWIQRHGLITCAGRILQSFCRSEQCDRLYTAVLYVFFFLLHTIATPSLNRNGWECQNSLHQPDIQKSATHTAQYIYFWNSCLGQCKKYAILQLSVALNCQGLCQYGINKSSVLEEDELRWKDYCRDNFKRPDCHWSNFKDFVKNCLMFSKCQS